MAWRSSGASNQDLVENLWRNELITDSRVKGAFLKVRRPAVLSRGCPMLTGADMDSQVDRAHYAPAAPYEDSPQPIGYDATISAPHMHASAIEHLLPYILPSDGNPAPRVLDIGSGSGYLTHVLAELVGDKGTVVGVEHIQALRDLGEENMGKSEDGRRFLSEGRAKFRKGDGRKGWIEPPEDIRAAEADVVRQRGRGWDAIHVGASAKEVHSELIDQLRAPGRMFIPVDADASGWSQHVWTIDKDADGNVSRKKLFGVRYVPLTDAPRNG